MKNLLGWLLGGMMLCAAAGIRPAATLPPEWSVARAEAPDRLPGPGAKWYGPYHSDNQNFGWFLYKNKLDPKTVDRVWFRRNVTVPAAWNNRRIVLDFGRLDGDAILFVNGKRSGELLNPGGETEVRGLIPGRDNELLLYITRDYFGISRPFEKDALNYAARSRFGSNLPKTEWPLGVTAPVTMFSTPQNCYIDDVTVTPRVSSGTIEFDVETVVSQIPDGPLRLTAAIYDADGKKVKTVAADNLRLTTGRNRSTLRAAWSDPVLWELDRGYVYTVRIALTRGSETLDETAPAPFGYREITTSGREIRINGRPAKMRLGCIAGGKADPASENALQLHQLLGFNVFEIQPNNSNFYLRKCVLPYFGQEFLDRMDRRGIGAFLPTPAVSNAKFIYLTNPDVKREWVRQMKLWLKRYKHHPSILGWLPSAIVSSTTHNIHAHGMGVSRNENTAVQRVTRDVFATTRQLDPTRLAFGHSDGAVGDVATANQYLNFVPLQEREEWPSNWAVHGDLPYLAVEFGQPFTMNFWKDGRFLITEYLAMYFGDNAYAGEHPRALPLLKNHRKANKWTNYRQMTPAYADYPLFYEFEKLFITRTQRAWRTWGVNGWFNWDMELGYGMPPKKIRIPDLMMRYQNLEEYLTAKPAWASPRWDYIAGTHDRFLCYIGGTPVHTDKKHAFRAGEKIEKQLILIWDGPGEMRFDVSGAMRLGKINVPFAHTVHAKPGTVNRIPLTFPTDPALAERTDGEIFVQTAAADGRRGADTFAFTVWPPLPPPEPMAPFALFDPFGESAPMLQKLKIPFRPWKPGDALAADTVLILGRKALEKLEKFPVTPEQLRAGQRVIVLEQLPRAWESLGLISLETMPRYVFPRSFKEPLFAGFKPEDFVNWNGTPTLLPEKKWPRPYDIYRAPKWTNTHAIASAVLEIPLAAGFEPLMTCEFDLRYSPLLRFNCGRGSILLSSIDWSEHVAQDPAAEAFARRVFATAAQPVPANRAGKAIRTRNLSTAEQRAVRTLTGATELPLQDGEKPADTVLIAGHATNPAEVADFARRGGTVLFLPRTAEELKAVGPVDAPRDWYRVAPVQGGPLGGVPQRLLRWRDALRTVAFRPGAPGRRWADGAILEQPTGTGRLVFCQLDVFQLGGKAPESDAARNAAPSLENGFRLYSALLANLGAGGAPAAARRLTTPAKGKTYADLNGWNVCGPFALPDRGMAEMIRTPLPPEADALAGLALPDTVYHFGGKTFDWRRTVSADAEHYIDLARELDTKGTPSVAYLTRKFVCERDMAVEIRLGMDYFLAFYLNGELVFDARDGGKCGCKPNSHRFAAFLKKGENVFTIKIAAGSAGFGLYANMAEKAGNAAPEREQLADLYTGKDKSYDPYQFFYW